MQPRAGDFARPFQPPEHMMQTLKYASTSLLLCILSLPAAAQGVDDGHDKEWRQLTDTAGATWNQLAAVCPRDGQTPCAGGVGAVDLTGWVWASDAQALALFSYTEPAITGNRSIAGLAHFGTAAQSGQIVLSLVSIAPASSGITLNTTTGALSVAPKTDSGSYTLTYRICDATDPANCDSATVAINLSGRSP